MQLVQGIKSFWNDEEGAAAVEYAILVAVIAGVVVAAVSQFNLAGIFTDVADKVKAIIEDIGS
jgi:Flp pilus assembly pilin Flp